MRAQFSTSCAVDKNNGQCKNCPLFSTAHSLKELTTTAKGGILFVGAYPTGADMRAGHYSGLHAKYFWELRDELIKETGAEDVPMSFTYAVKCIPTFNDNLKKYEVGIDTIHACSTHLLAFVDKIEPTVIVAMGSDAIKGLGFKETASKMRGGIYHISTFRGRTIPVVATYHLVQVSKNPGLYPTFKTDLKKAFSIATDKYQTSDPVVETATTYEDTVTLLENAIAELEEKAKLGVPFFVAIDTETTSLTPYVKEDRVTLISLSWKEWHGIAYPWQHKDAPFTDEQFEHIKELTERLLNIDKVRLTYTNGKFDIQWLKYHYGVKFNDIISHDVMLCEHVLDEDKKGEYSLKVITKDRFPSLGKYEDELKNHLTSKWSEKDVAVKVLRDEWKDQCYTLMVDWWVKLSQEMRIKLLSLWADKDYIKISDISTLANIKTRKVRGQEVLLKKYSDAVAKMLKTVPIEECSGLTLPEVVIPDELLVKNYEDADLDKLLWYAAVDALTTLLCTFSQRKDLKKDKERMDEVSALEGSRLESPYIDRTIVELTLPTTKKLAEMEYYGVKLDRERAIEYRNKLTDSISETRQIMLQEAGYDFNPMSNRDLVKVLFKDMGLPIKKYTETGEPSTDADSLKEIFDEHPDCKLLESLLLFRKLSKVQKTYIDNWLDYSAYDGHIHCSFIQTGTTSYRLSSSNPNLGR